MRIVGLPQLTAFRAHFGAQSSSRQKFTLVVVSVCLVLLALLAVGQVAHLHANQSDADHCQLCIVLHTLVPAAIACAEIVFIRFGAPTAQTDPIVVARQRQFGLFIRPPPVSC
jgi:hypothetical protein